MRIFDIKKILLFSLLLFCSLALPTQFKLWTHGFKLEKLYIPIAFSEKWEREPLLSKETLKAIFSQPFSFLGKGAQSYVFESKDGDYVLKLFRFDSRRRRFWNRHEEGWQEKTALSLFRSALLGWDHAREETALLFLHLNLTSGELPGVTLKTPLGGTVELSLDNYRFALQRKAVSLKKALEDSLCNGTLEEKMEAFSQLLEERTRKGIGNSDPSLWRNFGFIGEKAVEIDFGNYIERPDFSSEKAREKEIARYMMPFKKFCNDQRASKK
ncbi:MAG: hypothetical protein KGI80_04840 [Verrucomicrobiota bacterium]|nr:hypothetical protein [Verrucomicrobiota bacterium]